MTKEQYIEYRKTNDSMFLYEFYKEKFDESKNHKFLDISTFFNGMTQWVFSPLVVEIVISYYDSKFNVLKIVTKDNKVYYS